MNAIDESGLAISPVEPHPIECERAQPTPTSNAGDVVCTCMGTPSCGDGAFESSLRRKCAVHGKKPAENKPSNPVTDMYVTLKGLYWNHGATGEVPTEEQMRDAANKVSLACKEYREQVARAATAEADLAKAKHDLEAEQRAMEVVVAENSQAREVIAELVAASDSELGIPHVDGYKRYYAALKSARAFMEGKEVCHG
ncbi:hypothetical protein [Agrobacterium tumefaciens]|uniref:Uncharacterized protein n=1 Tax=Agrobacterium tumefaciens TaxID=358 RepID=A0A176WW89_AGRTU|nr:hypothetical protein [Agrobacterium tumefaciens]OAE37655.1 hypothetical protein A7J57_08740 [Agrobacterium tumefaciens]